MPNNPRHKPIPHPLRTRDRARVISAHPTHALHHDHTHGPLQQYPSGVVPHVHGEVDAHANFAIAVGDKVIRITYPPEEHFSGQIEMPPWLYEAIFKTGLNRRGT